MVRYHLALSIIVACGLLLGQELVPDGESLALIHLKARNYTAAKDYFARFDHSESLPSDRLTPLLQLHLQTGDVNGAVDILERFVSRHPRHLEARRLLVDYYRLSQRPVDALNNLEAIRALRPSRALLEELAERYDLLTLYDRERDVLRQLARDHGENPAYHVRLAELSAAAGLWREAAEALIQFQARHPREMNHDLVVLQADMLILDRRPEEALTRSREWLERAFDPETAAALGDMFHHDVDARMAWNLLSPWGERASGHDALLAKWSELAQAVGEGERALEYLEGLSNAGRLPLRVVPQLVELALAQDREEVARRAVTRHGGQAVDEWLLVFYLDHVIDRKKVAAARFLTGWLNESFLAARPLQAARLAWLAGERRVALARLEAMGRELRGDLNLWIGAHGLLVEMGERERAMTLARELARRPDAPEWLLSDLAYQFIERGEALEGWRLFGGLLGRRAEPGVWRGWALLAVGA
ncbi:MAG: hypothetical protein HQL96_08120, partial [Magnetococcales bacterium]|nr:hypothetical protein [Magnetococcales bacterium]